MNEQIHRAVHSAARGMAREIKKVRDAIAHLSPIEQQQIQQYFNNRVGGLTHGWGNHVIDDPSLTRIIEESEHEELSADTQAPQPDQIRE